MKKKVIREKAEELLALDYPKQGVYDLLRMEWPLVKEKKIADVVRHLASNAARSRYASLQRFLLVLIVLSAALQIYVNIPATMDGRSMFRALIKLTPFSSIMLGIAVYQHRGDVYEGVAVLALIGSAARLTKVLSGGMTVIPLLQWCLLLSTGILTLVLYRRLYPKYTKSSDPQGPLIVFPPEPDLL